MKYIRKEIIKGIEPIADQDFKITGDIDITGSYLQTEPGGGIKWIHNSTDAAHK
mgnify:CR=1 FL=1|jgi:hypothetical protein|tara:strand:- start:20601 stop:20762 length:162 start_codon:yes stop_codon:yes gene_type:complete